MATTSEEGVSRLEEQNKNCCRNESMLGFPFPIGSDKDRQIAGPSADVEIAEAKNMEKALEVTFQGRHSLLPVQTAPHFEDSMAKLNEDVEVKKFLQDMEPTPAGNTPILGNHSGGADNESSPTTSNTENSRSSKEPCPRHYSQPTTSNSEPPYQGISENGSSYERSKTKKLKKQILLLIPLLAIISAGLCIPVYIHLGTSSKGSSPNASIDGPARLSAGGFDIFLLIEQPNMESQCRLLLETVFNVTASFNWQQESDNFVRFGLIPFSSQSKIDSVISVNENITREEFMDRFNASLILTEAAPSNMKGAFQAALSMKTLTNDPKRSVKIILIAINPFDPNLGNPLETALNFEEVYVVMMDSTFNHHRECFNDITRMSFRTSGHPPYVAGQITRYLLPDLHN